VSRRSCLSRWVALVAFLAGVVPASGHVLIDRALDNPLAPSVARFGELVVVDALELVPDPQPPNRFFLAVAWCAHDLLEPGRQAPKNLVHGTTSASFQNPGKSFPEKRFRVFPRGACTNVTLRARWYDPRNGSFLSEDPMGDVDSPNLYAFVGWQPNMAGDPLGLGTELLADSHMETPEERAEARYYIGQALANPYVQGTLQVAGGCSMAAVGTAGAETGVGVFVAVYGADMCMTGLEAWRTGQTQETLFFQGVRGSLVAAGVDPTVAQWTTVGVDLVVGVGSSVALARSAAAARAVSAGGELGGDLASGARSAHAPVSGDEWFDYFRATYGDSAVEWVSVESGSYKDLARSLRGTGLQANHLNQDAVFRSVIATDEGVANAFRGNAFSQPGTEHYLFHRSFERLWQQYRSGGQLFGARPTMLQYRAALARALRETGSSAGRAEELARRAALQTGGAGLGPNSLVPRIPGRMWQRR